MKNIHEFPVQVRFPIAWGDMDAFNHVNNVIYFRYFENALSKYLDEAGFFELKIKTGASIVAAEAKCTYLQSLSYPDNLIAGARVSSIGKTSVTFESLLVSEKVGVAASGKTVMVLCDLNSGQTINVPAEIKTTINKLQKRAASQIEGKE